MGKSQDAAKHPIMHRTAPITKNYPVQNISSAEVKQPCSRTEVSSLGCTLESPEDLKKIQCPGALQAR